MDNTEDYYEILKVPHSATISEIVQAYHVAKNAFSPDSIATYSLLDAGETKELLNKLEEAYSVLSNLERRRQYDLKQAGYPQADANPVASSNAPAANPNQVFPTEDIPATMPVENIYENLSGGILCEIREKRGMSLEDVARITKIPTRYLKYIETNNMEKLPAVVYVQGFIKNLAVLYKLDAVKAGKSYIEFQSKKTSEIQTSDVNKSSK